MSDSTARQYLRRLADDHRLIARVSTGIYGPVTVAQLSREQDRIDDAGDQEPAEPVDSDDICEADPTSQNELVLSGS